MQSSASQIFATVSNRTPFTLPERRSDICVSLMPTRRARSRPVTPLDRMTASNVTAVRDLSMDVPSGSVFGFLGPNGAGKSTTMRLILGLLRPTSGSVSVFGRSVHREPTAARRSVGALIERPSLYEGLDGRTNLDLTRRLLTLPPTEIGRVLEATDMTEHAGRRVGTYSLGMKQRLGIARAMLGGPRLLVLNEPTNGLDPEGIREVRNLLKRLPEEMGTTVFVSSHLLSEVEQVATHLGLVRRGRLALAGEARTLLAGTRRLRIGTPAPEAAVRTLRAKGYRKAVREGEDVVLPVEAPDGTERRRAASVVNRLLVSEGYDVFRLSEEGRSLEDLFDASVAATAGTS